MTDELREMIESARHASMTHEEEQEQRISFAYGNTHFENERITRDMVREAADELRDHGHTPDGHSAG